MTAMVQHLWSSIKAEIEKNLWVHGTINMARSWKCGGCGWRGRGGPNLSTNVSKIRIGAFFHLMPEALYFWQYLFFLELGLHISFIEYTQNVYKCCLFKVRMSQFVPLFILLLFFTWSSLLSFFDASYWWTRNQPKMLLLEKAGRRNKWWRAAITYFCFICIVCTGTILVYKGFSHLNSLNCSVGKNRYCILQSVELFLKTNVCYKCKCIFFQILYTIFHELSFCLHHHAQKEYI